MKNLLTILLVFLTFPLKSQENVNVLFVLDGSSSMMKKWGTEYKWDLAEESLLNIADSLLKENKNIKFGLRVYGHQSLSIDKNCKDTELKLPIAHNTLLDLKNKLTSITPKGITPLAYTLEQTKQDFQGLEGQKNILILITDGSESCLGNPCEILEILLEKEVIVKPVIIGLDIDIESLKAYHCIEEIFNPHTPQEFERNVLQVIKQSIQFTTLQVQLLNAQKKPFQTNLPLLFFNEQNQLSYTFYHRLNINREADTLLIDPLHTYKIEVHTLPKVSYENVKLYPNKHNIIQINAPTGILNIQTTLYKQAQTTETKVPYYIKMSNDSNYFHIGSCNQNQEYLYGNYDIDVLSLPITQFKNIQINQDSVILNIPLAGELAVYSKFPIHAALFTEINNELVNIYTFPPNSKQEILDLQPGNYSLLYRFDHNKKMIETQVKNFSIQSKETLIINL